MCLIAKEKLAFYFKSLHHDLLINQRINIIHAPRKPMTSYQPNMESPMIEVTFQHSLFPWHEDFEILRTYSCTQKWLLLLTLCFFFCEVITQTGLFFLHQDLKILSFSNHWRGFHFWTLAAEKHAQQLREKKKWIKQRFWPQWRPQIEEIIRSWDIQNGSFPNGKFVLVMAIIKCICSTTGEMRNFIWFHFFIFL